MPDSLRRLQSRFLVRGADDAATAADAGGSVGGKALREHSYADDAVAATPQVLTLEEGGVFL